MTTTLTSDEGKEPTINTGGESLSISEIMQRYRNDGSCEHMIEDALRRLSLIDSQAAGDTSKPVGWISCGLRHGRDRVVDIVFENADCAKAFIDGVEPVYGPIVAATQMRNKCVEKVKALRDALPTTARSWEQESQQNTQLTTCNEVIAVLESLPVNNAPPPDKGDE